MNNIWGAGRVTLGAPQNSVWISGIKWVSDGENEDFAFPVVSGYSCNVRAAIWWPESYNVGRVITDEHNDIDLYVYDNYGALRGQSKMVGSVFEKVFLPGAVNSTGNWTFRIRGNDVPYGAQKVYYVLYYETSGCSQ
jgi:hypothetical protein